MAKFPWKTALAGAALLAAAGYAFGAQLVPGSGHMQPQEMQGLFLAGGAVLAAAFALAIAAILSPRPAIARPAYTAGTAWGRG